MENLHILPSNPLSFLEKELFDGLFTGEKSSNPLLKAFLAFASVKLEFLFPKNPVQKPISEFEKDSVNSLYFHQINAYQGTGFTHSAVSFSFFAFSIMPSAIWAGTSS